MGLSVNCPLNHSIEHVHLHFGSSLWVNSNDPTVLPNPGIMVNKGNHPQMAELFSTGSSLHMRGTGRGAQVGGRTIQVSEILTGNHKSYHSIWGCKFSRTNQSIDVHLRVIHLHFSVSGLWAFAPALHRHAADPSLVGTWWVSLAPYLTVFGDLVDLVLPRFSAGKSRNPMEVSILGGYPNRWMVYFMEKLKKNY